MAESTATDTATIDVASTDVASTDVASTDVSTNGTEATGGTAPPPRGDQATAETQTATSPWHNILPDEYRDKGYVKTHDTLEGFLKHVDYWEGMRGRAIFLPEDPNDPAYEEKVKTVYKRLGAPDDAQAYQFDVP